MKLLLLLFFLNCNQPKDFKYPEEYHFKFEQSSFNTDDSLKEKNIFLLSKKYCDYEFSNEDSEIMNLNSEKFLNSKNKFLSIPYKIYKDETEFAISYNCCPTEICKYSKILKLENEKLISEEKIVGNIIYFDKNHYKILDDSITGLVFIFNRDKELEYILDNLNINNLKFNSKRSLTLLKEFEISLLKNKKSLNEDSIYKKFKLNKNTKIYILEEDERFYFVFFKSDEKSIDNILSIFEEDAENYLEKIQSISVKTKKEFKNILKEKYFQFGYVEKKIFE